MSLSIYKKGILIVLVPFAINFVWIGLFWHSLQRSTVWIETVKNEGDVILMISRSVALFNKLVIYAVQYVKASGDQGIKNRIEKDGMTLLETLKDLTQATSSDSTTSALTEKIARTVASFEGEVRAIAAEPNPLEINYMKRLPPNRFLDVMKDTTLLMGILKSRAENFNRSLEMEDRDRYRTKLIALAGLILNVLMAFALACYLQRSIAARVSELARKAHQLAAGDYGHGQSTGHDELTELDRELSLARHQLRDAYKFKQEFMMMMAGRLQESLRECIKISSLLEERETTLKDNASQKHLRGLRSNASSCLSLIEDMLLLESLESGSLRVDLRPAELRPLVAAAIELVANLALSKNVSIENQTEDMIVLMDSARIKQVLVNLFSNAIKFSPSGAVITIKSERQANRIRLSVIDKGQGMDRQVRARLFHKFYQSEDGKSAGGTGLGLAIARLIVEAHQGLIGVDSTVGQGSTFWFELPLQ